MSKLVLWPVSVLLILLCTTSCSKRVNEGQQQAQINKIKATFAPFSVNGVSISAPSDPAKVADYVAALSGHIVAMKTLNKKALQLSEMSKAQRVPATIGTAVPYSDIYMYSWISCQAGWQDYCSGDYDLTAPPGYQVCKGLGTITSSNNSQGYSFAPNNWYTNDTENPPRFRGEHFNIWARGSGTFLNQWGSNITVSNVGLRVIAADANDFDRYATGCDMPQH